MDVSGCTFKESAELSVVVVVLSVRAEENEIRANESAFKDQVCSTEVHPRHTVITVNSR